MKQKLLSIFIAIFTVFLGVNIIYTKSIPQGHNGLYYKMPIGDWAYLLGGIIIYLGLYIMIVTLKIKEEGS